MLSYPCVVQICFLILFQNWILSIAHPLANRYLVDWIAETAEDLRLDCTTVHVAAFYLDRTLLKAHDNAGGAGHCLVPKHLWQLVAMVCLRLAGKFEEREEDVTGDGSAMLTLADGSRVGAVEAFTKHLGDAATSVSSAQVSNLTQLRKPQIPLRYPHK